jgi:hypothetical protein
MKRGSGDYDRCNGLCVASDHADCTDPHLITPVENTHL